MRRTKCGIGIFNKKSLSNEVKQLKCNNRRVCGIVINLSINYACLLFSIHLPYDTYSNTVNEDYANCID